MRNLHHALIATALVLVGRCPANAAQCDDLDWKTSAPALQTRRALIEDDLVRLRDVGPANNELSGYPLFTLSPDGSRIAFQIRRAHPEANSYCLAMVVMRLGNNGEPVFVDRGGSFLQFLTRMTGQGGMDTGIPMVITPRWAPDGSWIAFLKREEGATQLWRASSDGRGSRALTGQEWNVVDFRVTDATHVVVRYQDQSEGSSQAEAREALTGFHYDDRFFPIASKMPIFAPPAPLHAAVLDVTTGMSHPIQESGVTALFEGADGETNVSLGDARVSLIPASGGVGSPPTISVARPGRPSSVCTASVCGAVEGVPWWNSTHNAVRFFRKSGWGGSGTEISEWEPGAKQARLLYSTEDYLVYCKPRRADELICLRETSVLPRHLVSIDLQRGSVTVLANFNPELAGLSMGAVSRIRLESSFGIKTFADVVLPVGYQPGCRYPLIVVQYTSRGFLRGGVGDEFPIQAYANHGYVVLSVQRPEAVGTLLHPATWTDVDRAGLIDFADRRNALSVVEQGVQRLIDEGIADPRAIGITGLSDGSSTVQFAALNSHLFSAGIASGCCWERGQDALLGPKGDALYRQIGWPPLIEPAPAFWSHISLAQNPNRVAFPILFDMADDEFRNALESYVALQESGKPVDMFVYPGEHHVKWQPAHRLAAYQRSIDWFDFWLRGKLPADPERQKVAQRWIAMRDQSATIGNREPRRSIQ